MLANRYVLATIVVACLACTGCFMGPVAQNHVSSTLSISQAHCQMTVQNNSFAGLCAQIQISNTGVETMHGWQLEFDLPADSHLQNSWNANFVLLGQHVTVTPTVDQNTLAIGSSVMLGYCASQTGTNIVATPGSCDGDAGTAITQNSNANVTASQVGSAETGTKTVAAFTASHAFAGSVQASVHPDFVTRIGQTAHTDSGLQGLVLRLDATDPAHAGLALWRDGVQQHVDIALPVDATDGAHTYGWQWDATGLRVSVDDVVLYSSDAVVAASATDVQAVRWVSVTPEQTSDAAVAP